ncbi:MAG: STAS domain-containing protein [Bdellovibrionota bacterium]
MSFLTYANRTFKFKEKLSIYKVSEIKKSLLKHYNSEANKSDKFYLDLSEVESIDTSVFQLFMALKKTVETGHGHLEIKKSCQAFDTLLNLLGRCEL